jgi:hypothetical protein
LHLAQLHQSFAGFPHALGRIEIVEVLDHALQLEGDVLPRDRLAPSRLDQLSDPCRHLGPPGEPAGMPLPPGEPRQLIGVLQIGAASTGKRESLCARIGEGGHGGLRGWRG